MGGDERLVRVERRLAGITRVRAEDAPREVRPGCAVAQLVEEDLVDPAPARVLREPVVQQAGVVFRLVGLADVAKGLVRQVS